MSSKVFTVFTFIIGFFCVTCAIITANNGGLKHSHSTVQDEYAVIPEDLPQNIKLDELTVYVPEIVVQAPMPGVDIQAKQVKPGAARHRKTQKVVQASPNPEVESEKPTQETLDSVLDSKPLDAFAQLEIQARKILESYQPGHDVRAPVLQQLKEEFAKPIGEVFRKKTTPIETMELEAK